jgi:ferredoxin
VLTLTIDGRAVAFARGETILQAASRAGFAIPSLCSYPGIEPPTSCFVCVVKVRGKGGFVPSCATLAEEGMVVESGSEEVRECRRKALELLMSEHAGDCEAPCHRICPAGLGIPELARQIVVGELGEAAQAAWSSLAMPGVLGRVCPAPCQKGCVRSHGDGAVEIRELHRGVADAAFAAGAAPALRAAPATGKRVVIIGAGPAGLACAFHLALEGHACTLVDAREEPGGMLRYGVARDLLPAEILDREIGLILGLGVELRGACRVGDQSGIDALRARADAIVFASGARAAQEPWPFAVEATAKGIAVDAHTFSTSVSGVFACGGAIAPCRMAVRAVGQGRLAAQSVHRFLMRGAPAAHWPPRFDSHLGRLDAEEQRALALTDLASTVAPAQASQPSPLPAGLARAAARCLQCACGKKHDCALRTYAHEYEINRDEYKTGARKRVARAVYASGLVHEPGKCIDCGRCVGVTAAAGVRPGLAFASRGFDVAVQAPFGAALDDAMGGALDRCVAACPVGALWRLPGACGGART